MDTYNDLAGLLEGDVASDTETLRSASRDASIFTVSPSLVIFPKNVSDVQKLVSYVAQKKAAGHDVSLTARSAGTDMGGGPLSTSIVVSFTKYFNRIIDIGSGTATVQPGVFYRDFEKATLAKELLLPSYTASKDLCTVGGMVANNSGGEKTLRYGKTEQYIKQLKMVLWDGNEYVFKPLSATELEEKKKLQTAEGDVYRKLSALIEEHDSELQAAKPRVSKNSAGYYLWNVHDKKTDTFDITKVIVGSQGTFGLITEITFALIKPKKYRHMVVTYLNDMEKLPTIVQKVLAHDPESFESFDDHTFHIAMKFLPQVLGKLKGNIFTMAWGLLPEVWMMLTGGIPKLLLMAEFTGDTDSEAHATAQAAYNELKKEGYKVKMTSLEEEKEYWVFRRESFNLLRQRIKNLHTAPFIDDFIVRPETLPEFLPKLYAILDQYHIVYTVAGHIGDGNFHIIPLMKFSDPNTKKIITELSQKVYELIVQYKGSITAEHNDGLIRSPFLELMYGKNICALFEQTKDIFDPQGLFNPGKKVHASMQYALDHINHD